MRAQQWQGGREYDGAQQFVVMAARLCACVQLKHCQADHSWSHWKLLHVCTVHYGCRKQRVRLARLTVIQFFIAVVCVREAVCLCSYTSIPNIIVLCRLFNVCAALSAAADRKWRGRSARFLLL